MRRFLLLTVALQLYAASAPAQNSEERPRYSLRVGQVYPGVADRFALSSGSPYPLTKRYEAFTLAEKATLRSFYLDMPETDDPPFPVAGMRQIVADLSLAISEIRVEGDLTVFVQVNAKGEATGAKIIEYPSPEIAKAAAFILMKARYKPATCSGTPCPLEFPFRFSLLRQ